MTRSSRTLCFVLLLLTAGCADTPPRPVLPNVGTGDAPCPPWTQPTPDDNAPLPRLGCTTARNLRQMIADPADLTEGQRNPIADGAALAASVARYRKGDTKPLLKTDNASTTGSQ
jgi:type IV pilus biogenesis protein CpaD/CtpE